MADGFAALDAHIARIKQLPGMVERVAPAVGTALERELRANIARGVGPDGTPLQPTKAGEQPLKNAAQALRVRAIGTSVVAVLEGPEALHHRGRARGGVRRPILPTKTIPDPVVKAIDEVVTADFKKTMGGG